MAVAHIHPNGETRPRLVRLTPLERPRGQVAIYLASQGFPALPCHWPLRTRRRLGVLMLVVAGEVPDGP